VSVDVIMSERNAAVMEVRRAKHAESKAETARHQVCILLYILVHICMLLVQFLTSPMCRDVWIVANAHSSLYCLCKLSTFQL
jgi:hypothetical protein